MVECTARAGLGRLVRTALRFADRCVENVRMPHVQRQIFLWSENKQPTTPCSQTGFLEAWLGPAGILQDATQKMLQALPTTSFHTVPAANGLLSCIVTRCLTFFRRRPGSVYITNKLETNQLQ